MKKHKGRLLRFVLLLPLFLIMSYNISAIVLWHNLSDSGSDPSTFNAGISADVYNDDIDIRGVNALVEGIHVVADTTDVTITVTNEDSTITGTGNRIDNVATTSARLYLFADTGRTITVNTTYDLIFRGTASEGDTLDLMITVSGAGTVDFTIGNDTVVTYTANAGSGGAHVYVGMTNSDVPTLKFRRADTSVAATTDIEVRVGDKSSMGYLADTTVASGNANESGAIVFDPSSAGTGLMILRLKDNSNISIFGRHLTSTGGLEHYNFLLSDIDLEVPAGDNAIFRIENANSGSSYAAPLRVINENHQMTDFMIDSFCDGAFAFTGTQKGFVLGANAEFTLNNLTYLDYCVATTNMAPTVHTPRANLRKEVDAFIDVGTILGPNDVVKLRNAGAFFVDGNSNANATTAAINFNGDSGMYFRSVADVNGDVSTTFTVDPYQLTPDAGNILFDIEGLLNVNGDSSGNNVLNVLSMQVNPTGGSVLKESSETQFPIRTFAKDGLGTYYQYNRGCFLINNCMTLNDMTMLHTDIGHNIYIRDTLGRRSANAQPTYIGGERFYMCLPENQARPTISMINSTFKFHTSAGFTGVDVQIPNDANGNNSTYELYSNGRKIDSGFGRTVLHGTNDGSLSASGLLIDKDSHLDVFQTTQENTPAAHNFSFITGLNDDFTTEGLTYDITNQNAVQTIFLGNGSNISIGTNADTGTDKSNNSFVLTTTPTATIAGSFLSFETEGGNIGLAQGSGTTGKGGIFVDKLGVFKINSGLRASMATMVIRNKNGTITLPKNQVFFDHRVGISEWDIDLSDSTQRVLVPSGEVLSDFSLDWGIVKKDFDNFTPFEPAETPTYLFSGAGVVTNANLQSLPTVQGTVDQFQIIRSRLGDQVHLKVDGGHIRELIFLKGSNSAEAALGFLTLENNGKVGLGNANRNYDSVEGAVVLGINGLILCPNGDSKIELNEDIVVNNYCHILTGTAFGVSSANEFEIHSSDPHEFRIKSTGVLDLSQFNSTNKKIKFSGETRLVLEPGAMIILGDNTGGGEIKFTDRTEIKLDRVLNSTLESGTTPASLDAIRVKLIGSGNIVMEESAKMLVDKHTYFGVENHPDYFAQSSDATNITWTLNGDAKIEIGNGAVPGGAFQIGSTECTATANVAFRLVLNGRATEFTIGREGFFGLGAGIVDKASSTPDSWLVNGLESVTTVTIQIDEGTFRHNQIFAGSDTRASIFAIGPCDSLTFSHTAGRAAILGGGNLILLKNIFSTPCTRTRDGREMSTLNMEEVLLELEYMKRESTDIEQQLALAEAQAKISAVKDDLSRAFAKSEHEGRSSVEKLKSFTRKKQEVDEILRAAPAFNVAAFAPVVGTTNGSINNNLSVGIMASKFLLRDGSKSTLTTLVGNLTTATGTSQNAFDYLATGLYSAQQFKAGNFASNQLQISRVGFVLGSGTIVRQMIRRILGNGTITVGHDYSLRVGSVGVTVDSNNEIIQVTELRGA